MYFPIVSDGFQAEGKLCSKIVGSFSGLLTSVQLSTFRKHYIVLFLDIEESGDALRSHDELDT
jgi:hypothetical protein